MPNIHARCHCGTFVYNFDIAQLPYKSTACHCNICRRLTGALYHTSLPAGPKDLDLTEIAQSSGLIRFDTSKRIERWFCGKCGSHVLVNVKDDTDRDAGWLVTMGAVEVVDGKPQADGGLEEFKGHEYVADTKDGGLAEVMGGLDEGVSCFWEDPEGKAMDDVKAYVREQQQKVKAGDGDEVLMGSCYCGGTTFAVAKPDEAGKKWEACLCACRSCRLSFGMPIMGWAMVIPLDKINRAGREKHDGELFGTLKRFQSSERAHRDFCMTCGASVFFYTKERPGRVDIAFGLLDAPEGVLAKSWFEWDTKKVHYPEDAVDQQLAEKVSRKLSVLADG